MKKLAFLLMLPLILWQCNPGPSKTELRQMNDSLLMETAQKEIQLNQFVETMGEIEENIRLIKEKEQIISLQAETGDTQGSAGERINEDIQLIYDLMVQNKDRIQQLESQMKNTGVDNSKLNKLIAGLNQQLQEQSQQIIALQDQLEQRDVHISHLSNELFTLNYEMDSIRKVTEATRSQLDMTTDEFNTAWFAIGTRSELRDKNILTRDGFLFFGSTHVLKEDFDKQYFNQIDIREKVEFPLYSEKAEVLTSHPAGSFEITTGEDEMKILVITDSRQFWSISKYLVVQVN
jgi:predicted  nucleic acid-binding Zn-ribbon protein